MPDATLVVMSALRSRDLLPLAKAWLAGRVRAAQADPARFIAAALQVTFACHSATLDVARVDSLPQRGSCPVCGSMPVGAVVTASQAGSRHTLSTLRPVRLCLDSCPRRLDRPRGIAWPCTVLHGRHRVARPRPARIATVTSRCPVKIPICRWNRWPTTGRCSTSPCWWWRPAMRDFGRARWS